MKPTQDVEIANLLAGHEETQARTAESPPSPSWRWSRMGWGDWGARKISASQARTSATEPRDGATTALDSNTKD